MKQYLDLGINVLQKFENERQRNKEEEYKESLKQTKNLYDAEKRRALNLQEKRLLSEHEKCYNNLFLQLKRKIELKLEKLKEEHNKNLKDCMIKERLDTMQEMMQKLSDEMSDIVVSLCKHFHENLIKERTNFIKVFNYCISVERDMAKEQMAELEQKRIQDLYKQKKELEIQNLTNLTYVLCLEKMRYNEKKLELKCTYQKKLEIFRKLLVSLVQVSQYKPEKVEKNQDEEIQFYKLKILEVFKQYKALIDFTFDAIPEQADFLFNLESFLALTNHLETKKDQEEETNNFYSISEYIVDQCNHKWKPKKSLLKAISETNIIKCNFENYLYYSENSVAKVPLINLLEANGSFCIEFKKEVK